MPTTEFKLGDVVGLVYDKQIGVVVNLQGKYPGSHLVQWYPDSHGGLRYGNPSPDRLKLLPSPSLALDRLLEWLDDD